MKINSLFALLVALPLGCKFQGGIDGSSSPSPSPPAKAPQASAQGGNTASAQGGNTASAMGGNTGDYSMFRVKDRIRIEQQLKEFAEKEGAWLRETCGHTPTMKLSYGKWKTYLEEMAKEGSALSIGSTVGSCREVYRGISRACTADPAYATAMQKVREVHCTPAPDLKTSTADYSLEGGTFRVGWKWGTYNLETDSSRWLQSNL